MIFFGLMYWFGRHFSHCLVCKLYFGESSGQVTHLVKSSGFTIVEIGQTVHFQLAASKYGLSAEHFRHYVILTRLM
jgi:hypothetical protein